MNQPKKKNAGLTVLIALLLSITTIASCLGLYAWAKYISSQGGNATAQIAKWSFNVNLKKGQQTVALGSEPIDLATTTTHVASNRIAPGTSGIFDIEIDTTGTEVDLEYEVAISLENCPRNITFSRKTGVNNQNEDVFETISAGGASNSADLARTGITFSEYVANDAQNRVITERIKWDWPYTDANDTQYDTRDNTDESVLNDSNPKKIVTMNITVTGTEVLQAPAASVQSLAKSGQIQQWESIDYNPGTGSISNDTLNLAGASIIGDTKVASIAGASLSGTINASDAGDWVVLDVNETTGEVKIIPTAIKDKLTLSGADGYHNGVRALNKVCEIYKNEKYAESARSIAVEDLVNKGHFETKQPIEGTIESRYSFDENLNVVDNGTHKETQTHTETVSVLKDITIATETLVGGEMTTIYIPTGETEWVEEEQEISEEVEVNNLVSTTFKLTNGAEYCDSWDSSVYYYDNSPFSIFKYKNSTIHCETPSFWIANKFYNLKSYYKGGYYTGGYGIGYANGENLRCSVLTGFTTGNYPEDIYCRAITSSSAQNIEPVVILKSTAKMSKVNGVWQFVDD